MTNFLFLEITHRSNLTTLVLKRAIKAIGLDPNLYSIHSMRLGRGTDLEKQGISIPLIKKIGRWKSNAVYKYLKYTFFSTILFAAKFQTIDHCWIIGDQLLNDGAYHFQQTKKLKDQPFLYKFFDVSNHM